MYPLLKKELRTFLSSLIGYAVICVFLLLIGLFMWVFEGDMNTLDNGYAGLDTLFYLAPWVFMFLIPAFTHSGRSNFLALLTAISLPPACSRIMPL